jgi:hypothetical protein
MRWLRQSIHRRVQRAAHQRLLCQVVRKDHAMTVAERIAYLRGLPSFIGQQKDWDWLLEIAGAASQMEPRIAVLMDRVYPPDVWLPDDLTETYEELGPRRYEEGGRLDEGGLDEGSWMVKRINASLPRLRDALEAQP